MDELVVGDDYERALTHLHSEDWTVLGTQIADDEDEMALLEYDLKQVANQRPAGRSRREVLGPFLAGMVAVAPPQSEEDESRAEDKEIR